MQCRRKTLLIIGDVSKRIWTTVSRMILIKLCAFCIVSMRLVPNSYARRLLLWSGIADLKSNHVPCYVGYRNKLWEILLNSACAAAMSAHPQISVESFGVIPLLSNKMLYIDKVWCDFWMKGRKLASIILAVSILSLQRRVRYNITSLIWSRKVVAIEQNSNICLFVANASIISSYLFAVDGLHVGGPPTWTALQVSPYRLVPPFLPCRPYT